jgi:hypothetical protein
MCALCRRNLLVGEGYRHWEPSPDRPGERPVCNLCEPEAARAGWARAAQPPLREGAAGLRWGARLVA